MPRFPGRNLSLSGALAFARAVLAARLKTWLGRVRRDDYAEIRESGLFDPDWYAAHNREVGWAFVDPLKHYLAVGSKNGRQPFPLFDPDWYRTRYPDTAGVEPFTHFLRSGGAEGRSPCPFFDTYWYLHQNGALDDEGLNPLVHYLVQGAARKLNPSPRFDTGWYLAEYPDVAVDAFNPLIDYIESGRWAWRSTHATEPPPESPVEHFRDFPWSDVHAGHDLPAGQRGHFKLLFVLSSRLTETERADAAALIASLAEVPDLETFVVTVGGAGPIRTSAATLDLGEPSLAELDPKTVATRLAQALRDLAPLRAGILVGDDAHFRSALERVGVVCLDWAPAGAVPVPAEALLSDLTREAGYRPSRELRVSVVVPTSGGPHALERRLETILDQTRPPAEIVLVDDGSQDASLDLAEEFAAESSIPFTILRNDPSSGSRFWQWRKGIERARGDLVWIAEPDGESEPEFLEQMVPLFFDEALMLGYAQSKLVGAGGQIHATDHRFLTDDISPSRWAASYEAEGLDEIAVALSQKNTIPSVSAVMFRRGTLGALAPFLTDFRFAGDWWIYLEMARRGDVAFVARALNRRRRPDASTAEGGNGEAGPLAETLRIKAGLFRDLDLPSNVIHRSLGASVHDHVLRSREPGGAIPRLAQHPGATSSLQAMRGRLDARLGDIGVLRLLLVDCADLKLARTAATLLSNRATSFLLADEPSGEGAPAVEEPMLLFEGTRGVAPWAAARSADGRDLGPEHRVEVLCELARFHRIDALVSLGAAGHDLAPRLAARAGLPWLVVLTSDTTLPKRARKKLEAGSDGLISTPGRLAQALHGDGAAQFLQAVAQAVERRRDRLAASSPEATPDAMPTG